jgi:hypothetical protein
MFFVTLLKILNSRNANGKVSKLHFIKHNLSARVETIGEKDK